MVQTALVVECLYEQIQEERKTDKDCCWLDRNSNQIFKSNSDNFHMNFSKSSEEYMTILKQTLVKERDPMLSEIPDDFYQKLHVEMKNLKGKELQNINDMLHEFVRIRHSKIIQFASVMNLCKSIEDKLSFEEKMFYHNVYAVCKAFLKKIL